VEELLKSDEKHRTMATTMILSESTMARRRVVLLNTSYHDESSIFFLPEDFSSWKVFVFFGYSVSTATSQNKQNRGVASKIAEQLEHDPEALERLLVGS